MCEPSARTEKCSAECRQSEYSGSSELRHLTVPAKSVAERFFQVQVWLSRQLQSLSFHDPVHTIYDPLEYAAGVYYQFVHRFCQTPKAVLMLGMNPGPWGMAQTGVQTISYKKLLGSCIYWFRLETKINRVILANKYQWLLLSDIDVFKSLLIIFSIVKIIGKTIRV